MSIGRKGVVGFLLIMVCCLLSARVAVAAEKRFGGVGLQVVPTEAGELVVLKVVSGSPAMAGGLKPGDMIVRVNDFPLAGSDFREVVSRRLAGEVGSPVTLDFLRPGEASRHRITLKRAPIDADVASPPGVRMLTPGEN